MTESTKPLSETDFLYRLWQVALEYDRLKVDDRAFPVEEMIKTKLSLDFVGGVDDAHLVRRCHDIFQHRREEHPDVLRLIWETRGAYESYLEIFRREKRRD